MAYALALYDLPKKNGFLVKWMREVVVEYEKNGMRWAVGWAHVRATLLYIPPTPT